MKNMTAPRWEECAKLAHEMVQANEVAGRVVNPRNALAFQYLLCYRDAVIDTEEAMDMQRKMFLRTLSNAAQAIASCPVHVVDEKQARGKKLG